MHSVFAIKRSDDKVVVCTVFHGGALNRLSSADPCVVIGDVYGILIDRAFPNGFSFKEIDFLIAYEADEKVFLEKAKEGKPMELLKYLGRGWQDTEDDKRDFEVHVFPRAVEAAPDEVKEESK